MKQSEANVQSEIRIALSASGICIRLQSGMFQTLDGRPVRIGLNGLPDLMHLSFDGRVTFIECKNSTGRIRPEQIRFLAWLTDHGFTAGIARSVPDALHLIGVDHI